MILRINEFQAVAGKDRELHSFLQSLIPYITAAEGCISCEVLQSLATPANFVVLERWETAEFHQQSLARFPQEQMQSAMALFGTPPKGDYYIN
jgi:heme oxygenase (mycobilin-producing)